MAARRRRLAIATRKISIRTGFQPGMASGSCARQSSSIRRVLRLIPHARFPEQAFLSQLISLRTQGAGNGISSPRTSSSPHLRSPMVSASPTVRPLFSMTSSPPHSAIRGISASAGQRVSTKCSGITRAVFSRASSRTNAAINSPATTCS